MNNNKFRRGFTFVELMIVIIVLSLLVAFVAPKMFGKLGKARHEIARSKMAIIEKAVEEFYVDCGRYPTDDEGFNALIEPPQDDELAEKWQGRYCKPSDLLDPWGNPYEYFAEGSVNIGSYDIVSLGKEDRKSVV